MSEPDIAEFERFIALLLKPADEGYQPWLFRCAKGGKAPATEFGSWKSEDNRLTPDEAVDAMEQGYNIGIAGMENDRLVNVDIDDEDETDPDEIKDTMVGRSRSRTGRHAWYFAEKGEDIPNIPTDDKGEVRSQGQYVLAPGSYVPTNPEDVPEGQEDYAGQYTVENERGPATLTVDELPEVFLSQLNKSQAQQRLNEAGGGEGTDTPDIDGKSAVFDVTAKDVAASEGASTDPSDRWESAFHGSTTGHNMSLSGEGRIQCWRHNVAHGGLQGLVALSDHPETCESIGTGHKGSNAGPSSIKGDDSAIWHAWKYAKNNNYIPDDDPVPYRALKHLCRDRDLCPNSEIPNGYNPEEGETIPDYAYNAAIESIENYDDIDSGRQKTGEISGKTTDGGVSVEQEPHVEDSENLYLDAQGIVNKAGYNYGDEDGQKRLNQLKHREIAHAMADLIADVDDWNFLWSPTKGDDEPILWGYNGGIWSKNGLTHLRIMSREVLGPMNTKKLMNKVKHSFFGIERMSVDPDEMGAPDKSIPVQNGLLYPREHAIEGEAIQDLEPEHRATKQLETKYAPDADYEDTLFIELMRENIRDEEDLLRLQEYAGYTLWHHAQPEGKAMFLLGPTDSGKSLFLDVLKGVLGRENVASESLENLMAQRWGVAQLYGKLANIRNEVTAEALSNVQRFKELTGGGDEVTAEFKNGRKFDFTVNQKFLFATNQIPSVKHADEAFFNRLMFVKFPETVPEPDQMKDADQQIIEEESSEVLNWMLEGLNRLRDQDHFTGERTIKEKKDVSNSWGGLIDRFTHNVLEITGDAKDIVHKGELFGLFDQFASWTDREYDFKQQGFTKKLKTNAGVSDGQSKRVGEGDDRQRVFKGLKVKEEALDELDADAPDHAYGEESKTEKQARLDN